MNSGNSGSAGSLALRGFVFGKVHFLEPEEAVSQHYDGGTE